jgi:hypothetical protein
MTFSMPFSMQRFASTLSICLSVQVNGFVGGGRRDVGEQSKCCRVNTSLTFYCSPLTQRLASDLCVSARGLFLGGIQAKILRENRDICILDAGCVVEVLYAVSRTTLYVNVTF